MVVASESTIYADHRSIPPSAGKWTIDQPEMFIGSANVSSLWANADEAYRQCRSQQTNMRRDPDIMEPLRARQLATALLDWQIVPEDDSDPEQQTMCDLYTVALKKMPQFTKFRLSLLEAAWFGKYGAQIRYEWKDLHGGMCLVPAHWRPVHGDKLQFDRETGQVGVMVRTSRSNTSGQPRGSESYSSSRSKTRMGWESLVRMLDENERLAFVVHRHEIEDGDFFDPYEGGAIEGVGLRSRLYWPWWLKQKSLQWMMEFVERVGTGFTIFYYESGNQQEKAEMRTVAENYRTENYILFPRPIGSEKQGSGVERIEPSTGGAQFLQSLLTDYYGDQIRRMILGQTLTSKNESTGLGSKVAELHGDTFQRIVLFDVRNLDETLTTDLLEVMHSFRCPGASWTPRFESVLERRNIEELLKAAESFVGMGGEVSEKDLREKIGLPEPQEGEKKLGGQQAQQGGGGGGGGMDLSALLGKNINDFKG